MKKRLVSILCITTSITLLWLVTGLLQPAAAHPVQAQGLGGPLRAAGIELTPATAEQWGIPNTVITYTLTLKNTGSDPGDYSVAFSGNKWSTWANPSAITGLAAGASTTFNVMVAIPSDATIGVSDTATVTVTLNGGGSLVSTLTTRVVPPTTTPQSSSARPVVVISAYSIDIDAVEMGENFTLSMDIYNQGETQASNLVVEFSGTDFLPRSTGGLQAVSYLEVGRYADIDQPMVASWDLWGKTVGTIGVKLSYTDTHGNAYSDNFTLTINLAAPSSSSLTRTPTPTTTAAPRPQMMIQSYATDVDPLQPGTVFSLTLDIMNLGSGDARAMTMVLGGGVTTETASGTPVPGGVSGSGADLTNFAPLGSSNLLYLGDVGVGSGLRATMKLIVNVNAQPGAYPLKVSFVYDDTRGTRLVDDQVITLLVYSMPQMDIGFYRDPGVLFAGQPNSLPLQVTNLGKKTVVMGNMTVTSADADVTNNVSLVGALEPGGYFTLDSMVIPMQAGALEIMVTINYTDDFNQARTIQQSLSLLVEEMPTMDPMLEGMGGEIQGMESGMGMATEETLQQKILRFVLGLIGLDSAPPQDTLMPGMEYYEEQMPVSPYKGG